MQLLLSARSEYSHLITAINGMNGKLKMSWVIPKLLHGESPRSNIQRFNCGASQQHDPQEANMKVKCFNRGNKGHYARDCLSYSEKEEGDAKAQL